MLRVGSASAISEEYELVTVLERRGGFFTEARDVRDEFVRDLAPYPTTFFELLTNGVAVSAHLFQKLFFSRYTPPQLANQTSTEQFCRGGASSGGEHCAYRSPVWQHPRWPHSHS